MPAGVAINITLSLLFTDTFHAADLTNFDPVYFLITVLLIGVPWFTKTFRLMNWLHLTPQRLSFRETFRITVLGDLGAAISPTAIGGSPVKAALLTGHGLSAGESASLATVIPLEDIIFFLIAMPLALFISPTLGLHSLAEMRINPGTVLLWVLGIAAGLVLLSYVTSKLFHRTKVVRKITAWLQEFWTDFFRAYNLMIRRGKLRFLVNMGIAGIQWTARYALVPLLLYSLGYRVNFLQFFILYWLLASMASFIPTPGATGAAEGAFLIVFSKYIPSSDLGLVMIGWRFLSFYLLNIAGIVVVLLLELRRKVSDEPGETDLAEAEVP